MREHYDYAILGGGKAGKTLAGETEGLLKAVVEAGSGKILGGAVLAPEGGEMVAVLGVAIRAGLPYQELRDMVFSHPTMCEGFNDLFASLR